MYDVEFRPAVQAVHAAAQDLLRGRASAAPELHAAISRHLPAIQGFNKLSTSGDTIRARLVRNCQEWQAAELNPNSDPAPERLVQEIAADADWFVARY